MDRQADLIMVLMGTRVLSVVDQDGLELTIACQVRPQQESETVLECLKSGGVLFLPRDVCVFHPY